MLLPHFQTSSHNVVSHSREEDENLNKTLASIISARKWAEMIEAPSEPILQDNTCILLYRHRLYAEENESGRGMAT
jgi:hypothetical protein